ncbi:MAG: ATP-binding cassette domain-containing protein [Christensenellales bacterium]
MNAIELNHVAKRYGDFALEDVNLTLPQGCVLGLIGENGAGKSTLIRMMLGACRPDGGEVRAGRKGGGGQRRSQSSAGYRRGAG